MDDRDGENSLDRSGYGHCPNPRNSKILRDWVNEGTVFEPFRAIYPDRVEHSYTSFRRENNFGKNRLDLFLISADLLDKVENVIYEDRLGRDFDHKAVSIKFGKRVGVRKDHI